MDHPGHPHRDLLGWLVGALCLVPLALLIWDAGQGSLGANPIQSIELRMGKPALVLLIASLAVTPVARLTGRRGLLPLRRTLGLCSFLYATLHALAFVGLDYGFDVTLLPEAIFQKRYALAGMAAYISLFPLALTSTHAWQVRLGHRWRSLHRLTYLAALLAAIHYVWQTKADITQPLLWAVTLIVLLLARLPSYLRSRGQQRPAS